LHYKIGYGFLDVATCDIHDLEEVWGIGRKTSRFFVMYTRPEDQEYAILDVHILRWLREQGHDSAPMQTPRSKKKYELLENAFIWEAQARGMTPLELDTVIWAERSRQ
jgi:thermostable 8-oxoguanine DNA glycosylase